ncbi:uncharacterized protein LOC126771891 isoform X2 [Nymphalis io]|uniref:uncharacterized protein LOC126771891 isoform X2 n=1 Tax=Inachis io TaxID=171585 RepID=UPI00216A4AF7|nr:uncharacterized protein LOC126771891 isoform X2 [Nymphalis io]
MFLCLLKTSRVITMKALTTAILLFFVLMAFTVEAGHHNRKSRSHVRGEKGEEDAANDAPKPDEVHNFDVPEVFTQAGEASDNDGNDEQPTRHHGGSHRRSRKH